ncbi:pyridine nucleotide-disulfide oxidoreductase [Sulfodiicoccus acidiphilus]|uniref:Pyridine nucleotide-disulfide oxidoreductase n=1 Tax=Sulfodiicoccus acidiphilus TaxID=1670455 RepID=A0A830GX53_9CREN|nr:pyridine nucleotide-disulfide oxidoreductase [Sulfodiicoccus acidiphilus]
MTAYDVVVIGSGPAGYMASSLLSRAGKSVLVIERGRFGGVCVNFGCVPSIFLHDLTSVISRFKEVENQFGLEGQLRLGKFVQRMREIRDRLSSAGEELVRNAGAEVIYGEAELKEDYVLIDGKPVKYGALLVATGSTPDTSLVKGGGVYTEDQVGEIDTPPETMIVVGGGYAGVEIAQFYARLGSNVTLVTEARLLGNLSPRLSEAIKESLIWDGVNVREGVKVTSVKEKEVVSESGSLKADVVILAAGRRPSVPRGTVGLGVVVDQRGILVNEQMKTENPRIWAAGDVVSKSGPKNAHTAMHEATVVYRNMMGQRCSVDYNAVPELVYTDPEVGKVGEEQSVREWAYFPLNVTTRSIITGFTEGFVRIGIDSSGRIVYGEAVGHNVEELMNALTIVVRAKMSLRDFSYTVLLHPSLGEALTGAAKSFFGEDVDMPLKLNRLPARDDK